MVCSSIKYAIFFRWVWLFSLFLIATQHLRERHMFVSSDGLFQSTFTANVENSSVPKRRVGNVIRRLRPSINSIWPLKMLCKFLILEQIRISVKVECQRMRIEKYIVTQRKLCNHQIYVVPGDPSQTDTFDLALMQIIISFEQCLIVLFSQYPCTIQLVI